MNRNVAILAVVSCVVLALVVGLAWSWRETTAASEPLAAHIAERVDETPREPGIVLDRGPSEIDSDRRTTQVVTQPEDEGQATADGKPADDDASQPKEPDSLLVAGTVVDQAKSLVFGARVVVYAPIPGSPMLSMVAEGVSDGRGHFEIRGKATPLQLQARASKLQYFDSELHWFTRGATDLKLVVPEGGVVAGRLLLDPWVPSDKIRVILKPTGVRPTEIVGPSWSRDLTNTVRLNPGGTFAQLGIAAPTVDLSVRVENDPWDAVHFEGVPVRAASELQDERLDPIDLRGLFELVDVVVLDPTGAKVDGARVQLRNPADPDSGCSRSTTGGRAQFLTRTGAHDFQIQREGFRGVQLEGVYGDQVVRLRTGLRVRITLRGLSPTPTPPDTIAIALMRATGKNGKQLDLGDIRALDRPGTTDLVVPTPGAYEVAWYLDHGRTRQYLAGGPARTVLVRDTDEIQEFVLEFPSEALAAVK